MNRKFKDALKQAYNIPEPSHKDEFLQKLENSMQTEQKRPWIPFFVRYAAVPLTALAFLGMYGGYSLLSGVKTEYVTERPAHTVPHYDEERAADEDMQTTETSIAEETAPEGSFLTNESGTTASDSTSASVNMLDVALTTTAPEQLPEQTRTTTVPETSEMQTKTTIASTTRITTTAATRTATTTRAAATTKATTTGRSTTTRAVSTTRQYDKPEPVITIPQTTTATAYTQTFFATTIGNQYEPTPPDEPVVTTTTEPSAPEEEIGRDLTVQPLHQYSILDNLVEGRFSPDYAPPADINGLIDWKDLEEWSECIVSGEIEAVYYTSVDGQPWTQMDILVDEWWKGDINISDRISVYIPGGFMSLTDYISENDLDGDGYYDDMTPEEIAVSTVYEPSPEGFEPFVGVRYLFFLSSGGYSIPDGAYFPGSIDYFSLYRPRGTYYSPISSYLDVLTQEELAEYLW